MAMQKVSPLKPGGRGAHWAPKSRRKIEMGYGYWLNWGEKNDDLDPDVAPGARATMERVERYLKYLQSRMSPFAVQSRLQDLGDALRVMMESNDFRWITRAAARLKSCAVSSKNKLQKIRSSDEIVDLGMGLMAAAEILLEENPVAAALLYRNGFIIALLAYRPMRVSNLAAITLALHLVRRGVGRWLMFSAEEMKSGRSSKYSIPASLEEPLDRYLSVFRPILEAQGAHRGTAGSALWISQDGGAFTQFGIAQATGRLTKAAFGHSINPHLFRDCAATMIATDDPEHVDIVRGVLDHAKQETSQRHYNHAQGLQASRRHQAAIHARRRKAKRSLRQDNGSIGKRGIRRA
jgi:site-specific recombinase XerD